MLFKGLFRRAERSFDSAVDRLLGRLAVAVPLLIAGGFATTALSIKLIEMYGTIAACTIMAVVFATISLIAMAVYARAYGASGEAGSSSDAAEGDRQADDGSPALPPEFMAVLTSVAPAAAPGIARGVARNLPLILILALIGFAVSRFAEISDENEDAAETDSETDAEKPQAA